MINAVFYAKKLVKVKAFIGQNRKLLAVFLWILAFLKG